LIAYVAQDAYNCESSTAVALSGNGTTFRTAGTHAGIVVCLARTLQQFWTVAFFHCNFCIAAGLGPFSLADKLAGHTHSIPVRPLVVFFAGTFFADQKWRFYDIPRTSWVLRLCGILLIWGDGSPSM
jgi:hypothetical protein